MHKFIKSLETLSIVFFALAYFKWNMQVATWVIMASMTLFVGLAYLFKMPLTKLQKLSWVLIVVLGIATVAFENEAIIKWKTTIVNSLLGSAFLLSHVVGKKPIMARLLGEVTKAPAHVLNRLNLGFGFYFLFVASLNLFVAYNFSTDVWMKFKLFGLFFMNLASMGCALYYLKDYLNDIAEAIKRMQEFK
jgi:intracellular septation protein